MKPQIVLSVFVAGKPQPAGSKNAHVIRNKAGEPVRRESGAIVTVVTDANKKSKPWQSEVKDAARVLWGAKPLLTVPLYFRATFYVLRPQSHFRGGKHAAEVKRNSAQFPASKPDVLKLARGVEDALTGVIWRDDAQIVAEQINKRYGEKPGVQIEVGILPGTLEETEQWMQTEKSSC